MIHKYRAWDGEIMHYWDSLNCPSISVPELFSGGLGKLMLYTGKKDTAKVEIYDGDIIKIRQKFWGEWSTGIALVEWDDKQAGFEPFIEVSHQIGIGYIYDFWEDEDSIKIKILGNKYENPELLRGVK
jgi:uncharacterized phage protein (TIGR01671 family)